MAPATEAPATAEGPTSHTLDQDQQAALDRMRVPFDPSQISKLPKVICSACSKAQYKVCDKHDRARCSDCGGNMTTAHIHLDYVGHAELTGRLLEADPLWQWEPLAFDDDGLPRFDRNGGLWIRLTVAGMTRLGYGDAQGKTGPNAVKEAIGDALRNAGMRFGAALALWSKTDMDTSKAETAELEREPSREDRLADLYALMQKRWGHIGGLRNVLALVRGEEFAESLVLNLNGERQPFAELIEQRVAALENPAPKKDPEQGATGTPATGHAETRPAEAPGTASPPTTAVSGPPAQSGPAGGPPSADSAEGAELDRLTAQMRDCWNNQMVLIQIRGAAVAASLSDHNVQGPPDWGGEWMGFGALLDRRLNELRGATNGHAA